LTKPRGGGYFHYVENKRNPSIELLRIIAIIGVVILHYNNAGSGGAFKYVQSGTLNYYVIYFTESIYICAVDLFVFISSYYLSSTYNRKLSKVVSLIIQVIIFNACFYLGRCLLGLSSFSLFMFIGRLLPVNYFVMLYSVLYLISPYINVVFNSLSKKQLQRLIILLFIILSIWSFGVDVLNSFGDVNGMSIIGALGSQAGYTIVNFSLIYTLASYIKKYAINFEIRKSIIYTIICICLIFIMSLLGMAAFNYNNPLVIICAILVFMIFNNLNIRKSKVINELSQATFTCFLFHGAFMSSLHVDKFVNGNTFLLLLHQLGCAIVLFLASYIVYKIYNFIYSKSIGKLIKKLDVIDIYALNKEDESQ